MFLISVHVSVFKALIRTIIFNADLDPAGRYCWLSERRAGLLFAFEVFLLNQRAIPAVFSLETNWHVSATIIRGTPNFVRTRPGFFCFVVLTGRISRSQLPIESEWDSLV